MVNIPTNQQVSWWCWLADGHPTTGESSPESPRKYDQNVRSQQEQWVATADVWGLPEIVDGISFFCNQPVELATNNDQQGVLQSA